MKTQPPFTYSDGINPPRLVPENPAESPSQRGWSRFAPRAAAMLMLQAVAKLCSAPPVLNDETYSEPGYAQVGDNPDKVGVYTIEGTLSRDAAAGNVNLPVDEWAGELIDRLIDPQDGIDQYPAGPNPTLHVSVSGGVAELFWKTD